MEAVQRVYYVVDRPNSVLVHTLTRHIILSFFLSIFIFTTIRSFLFFFLSHFLSIVTLGRRNSTREACKFLSSLSERVYRLHRLFSCLLHRSSFQPVVEISSIVEPREINWMFRWKIELTRLREYDTNRTRGDATRRGVADAFADVN